MLHIIYQERQFCSNSIRTSMSKIRYYRRKGWELIGIPHLTSDNRWRQKIRKPLVTMYI